MSAPATLRRAVFLDRDGVVNALIYNPEFGLVDSPRNPAEFRLIPHAASAIRMINDMGLLAIVVSNQPGLAKGKLTRPLLEGMTEKMYSELAVYHAHLDGLYYCLHHPEALIDEYRVVCDCRKPAPGMLLRAATELGVDLRSSFLIGDGLTDILAGKAVGCTTILLGRQKCDLCSTMEELDARPAYVVTSLTEAVEIVQRDVLPISVAR